MKNYEYELYGFIANKLADLITSYKFVPYKLTKQSKHEVGKIYWCSYWLTYYKVLEVNGSKVKVEWEDGHINEHMTSLDLNRDYELRPFEWLGNAVCASYSAAEIKALIYNGKIGVNVAEVILHKYYTPNPDHAPNDYVYYFITPTKDHEFKLKRDLNKSPHTFNKVNTISDVLEDKRIEKPLFYNKDGKLIKFEGDILDTIPANTQVLEIKYQNRSYKVKLDL